MEIKNLEKLNVMIFIEQKFKKSVNTQSVFL